MVAALVVFIGHGYRTFASSAKQRAPLGIRAKKGALRLEALGGNRGVAIEGLRDGLGLKRSDACQVVVPLGLIYLRQTVEGVAHIGRDRVAHAREHHHGHEGIGGERKGRRVVELEDLADLALDLLAGLGVVVLLGTLEGARNGLGELVDKLKDVALTFPESNAKLGDRFKKCSNE